MLGAFGLARLVQRILLLLASHSNPNRQFFCDFFSSAEIGTALTEASFRRVDNCEPFPESCEHEKPAFHDEFYIIQMRYVILNDEIIYFIPTNMKENM